MPSLSLVTARSALRASSSVQPTTASVAGLAAAAGGASGKPAVPSMGQSRCVLARSGARGRCKAVGAVRAFSAPAAKRAWGPNSSRARSSSSVSPSSSPGEEGGRGAGTGSGRWGSSAASTAASRAGMGRPYSTRSQSRTRADTAAQGTTRRCCSVPSAWSSSCGTGNAEATCSVVPSMETGTTSSRSAMSAASSEAMAMLGFVVPEVQGLHSAASARAESNSRSESPPSSSRTVSSCPPPSAWSLSASATRSGDRSPRSRRTSSRRAVIARWCVSPGARRRCASACRAASAHAGQRGRAKTPP